MAITIFPVDLNLRSLEEMTADYHRNPTIDYLILLHESLDFKVAMARMAQEMLRPADHTTAQLLRSVLE